jgi:hypothetical protein
MLRSILRPSLTALTVLIAYSAASSQVDVGHNAVQLQLPKLRLLLAEDLKGSPPSHPPPAHGSQSARSHRAPSLPEDMPLGNIRIPPEPPPPPPPPAPSR